MVRVSGANTNTEICPPLSPHSPAQRPTFNAPFPAAGGGLGCPLAWGPAQGTPDGRRAGRRGPRFARLLRPSPHGAARRFCSRNRDSSRPIERRPTGEILAARGRRRTVPARQRPASSSTTRKDFW
jgi:hypothetical protein